MEFKDGLNKFNVFASLHRVQLESCGVPVRFWLALFKKLENQILDAGNVFSIFKIDYEDEIKADNDPVYTVLVTKEEGVQCNDGSQIYIIDHAWTYETNKAASNLIQVPGLLDRMCNLMGIAADKNLEDKVEDVCKEMWRYNQTYSQGFGSLEHRVPVWYIMDEFGSAIEHSDDPNFQIVPFYYLYDQTIYSLLFPLKNVGFNEKVTRDYLGGLFKQEIDTRKALLIPWKPVSFTNTEFTQNEPDEKYFLPDYINETLPVNQPLLQTDKNKHLKVYSEYDVINTYLTDSNFQILNFENRSNADILWLTSHFKEFKNFSEDSPEKYINQFPCETVLTIKNLLSVVCRRRRRSTKDIDWHCDNPSWLPTTYDLQTDLVKFVSFFQNREKAGLDNFWICKPWNLARGLDTVITDNLNCILRLSCSGPKIAQKYIYNPVLFNRTDIGLVKFDVRYVILLRSVQPLKLFVYKNFFLRFANKPFDLTNFWDKEKHYTVMNYDEETPLFKMLCDEFIEKFHEQYSGYVWKEIEEKIFQSIKEVFEAASVKPPPTGIGHNVQSRALYAVDVILSREKINTFETIQPKILEVNWMPDCNRACQYYPTFFNDVFLLLFKDEVNETKFRVL